MTHGERGRIEVVGIKLIFFFKIKILRANYIVTHDIFNRFSQSLPVVDRYAFSFEFIHFFVFFGFWFDVKDLFWTTISGSCSAFGSKQNSRNFRFS